LGGRSAGARISALETFSPVVRQTNVHRGHVTPVTCRVILPGGAASFVWTETFTVRYVVKITDKTLQCPQNSRYRRTISWLFLGE
jgi:hypothetical protein